jgi:hypothetical protein
LLAASEEREANDRRDPFCIEPSELAGGVVKHMPESHDCFAAFSSKSSRRVSLDCALTLMRFAWDIEYQLGVDAEQGMLSANHMLSIDGLERHEIGSDGIALLPQRLTLLATTGSTQPAEKRLKLIVAGLETLAEESCRVREPTDFAC